MIKDSVELTAKDVIDRLREAAKPPGKKGLWLCHLNDKRLAEVYHRLKRGQAAYYIAKIAQVEWNVMPNSTRKSLSRGITQFRDRVLSELELDKMKGSKENKELTVRTVQKENKRKNKVDAYKELEWALLVQKERILALRKVEENSMPLKHTEREIRTFVETAEKMLEYGVRLGLISDKPPELNVNVKHGFDNFMKVVHEDSGEKVIEMAKRFLERTKEFAIPMREDEDGFLVPIPEDELPEEDRLV